MEWPFSETEIYGRRGLRGGIQKFGSHVRCHVPYTLVGVFIILTNVWWLWAKGGMCLVFLEP